MSEPAAPADDRCYRHPDREAYISCQRCERRICPHCMQEASVGFQCPECVVKGQQGVRRPTTLAGGAVPSRPGSVTTVIIGINLVVFALTYLGGLRELTAAGSMAAYDFMLSGVVYPGVAEGGYWRLLTSSFLHAGVVHVAFNCFALYLFGPYVERALGTRRFVVAYTTMAVVSSVFVYWLSNPQAYTVGASGAVFGLFGMALVLMMRAGQDVRSLLALLAINAVISVTLPNISWQGHLGGFLAGLALAAAVALPVRERRRLTQWLVYGGLWAAAVVAVAARTLTLA